MPYEAEIDEMIEEENRKTIKDIKNKN